MKVVKLMIDNSNICLLVDSIGQPVPSVSKYMKFLHNTGKSSNTMYIYCTALKHYFEYLEEIRTDYQDIDIDILSNFISWLRNPSSVNNVVFIEKVVSKRSEKTINLYITAVTNFYDYLYRSEQIDSDVVNKLMKKMFVGANGKGYKGFLHHVNKSNPQSKNILKLKEPKEKVQVLTKEQVNEIYQCATNSRDKFLIQLLFETGLRIGECLSLFHEDFVFDSKQRRHKISLTERGELPNGGKLKSGARTLDISQNLMDAYDDYLYEIIDEFEPNHNIVFVKLHGKNIGNPMTYSDVYATFKEIRRKTGIQFTPHIFRHTHGTLYYLKTKDIKVVQERLGHTNVQTTMNLYLHPSEDDIRNQWENVAHVFELKKEE